MMLQQTMRCVAFVTEGSGKRGQFVANHTVHATVVTKEQQKVRNRLA